MQLLAEVSKQILIRNFPDFNSTNLMRMHRKYCSEASKKSLYSDILGFLENPYLSIPTGAYNKELVDTAERLTIADKFATTQDYRRQQHNLTATLYNAMMVAKGKSLYPLDTLIKVADIKGYGIYEYPTLDPIDCLLDKFLGDQDSLHRTPSQHSNEVQGAPACVGVSPYFADEFIAFISNTHPYNNTRFYHLSEIFEALSNGCPVPIYVNDAVYFSVPGLEGGHYVLLVGFKGDNAVTVNTFFSDGHLYSFINYCPSNCLLDAMAVDSDRVCAWNINAR